MKIAIIGAGAMGCLLASYLSTHHHVTLIDQWQDQINHINAHGLMRERDGVSTVSHPIATANAHDAYESHVVIVMVKYHQTAWAATQAIHALSPDGLCVTLQNGVGGADILADTLGAHRVTQGVTSLGATLLTVGQVKHAGMGDTVFAANHTSPYLTELIHAFNSAGLPAHQHTNLEGLIWGKLIVNVGINALTAILRVRNGELANHDGARQLVTDVVNEAVMIADACNITLPYDNPVEHVLSVARATATNRSSTLQDVLRGSPSEIATINGAIVKTANSIGMTTPYNSLIVKIMAIIDSCNHSLE